MKNYTIRVNGNTYHVEVEEGNVQTAQTRKQPQNVQPAMPVNTFAAPAAEKVAEGGIKINAPMPGKILGIKAVPGQELKAGEVILILEAMKMENEIVAPEAGSLAGIKVSVGDHVEAGQLLATLH